MLCSYTRARGLRALQWELLLLQCSLQSPSIPVPAAASDRQLQEGLGGDGVCGETQGDRECQNQAVLWPSEGLSSQQVGLPKNRIPLEQNPPVLASRVSCIPGLLLGQAGWGQMAQPGPELLHRAGNISNVLMFPHSETIPKDPTEQGGGGRLLEHCSIWVSPVSPQHLQVLPAHSTVPSCTHCPAQHQPPIQQHRATDPTRAETTSPVPQSSSATLPAQPQVLLCFGSWPAPAPHLAHTENSGSERRRKHGSRAGTEGWHRLFSLHPMALGAATLLLNAAHG